MGGPRERVGAGGAPRSPRGLGAVRAGLHRAAAHRAAGGLRARRERVLPRRGAARPLVPAAGIFAVAGRHRRGHRSQLRLQPRAPGVDEEPVRAVLRALPREARVAATGGGVSAAGLRLRRGALAAHLRAGASALRPAGGGVRGGVLLPRAAAVLQRPPVVLRRAHRDHVDAGRLRLLPRTGVEALVAVHRARLRAGAGHQAQRLLPAGGGDPLLAGARVARVEGPAEGARSCSGGSTASSSSARSCTA